MTSSEGGGVASASLTDVNLNDLTKLGWRVNDLTKLGWRDNLSSDVPPTSVSRDDVASTDPSKLYWCTRQKPLTTVQVACRHTLIRWFRYVVPAMKLLHRYRATATYLANTRRRVVCYRHLEQSKQAIRTLQGFVRMVLMRATYQQTQCAVRVLQCFYRQNYHTGLLVRLRMRTRHRYLLMKHTTLAQQLHAAKRELACCNRELANIRNAHAWATCPITQEVIVDPVVNCIDGHLYEKEALVEWLKRDSTSPITRASMHRTDVVSLKDVKPLDSINVTYTSADSTAYKALVQQCNSLKCNTCNKVFHLGQYSSLTQMCHSFKQHKHAAHGVMW